METLLIHEDLVKNGPFFLDMCNMLRNEGVLSNSLFLKHLSKFKNVFSGHYPRWSKLVQATHFRAHSSKIIENRV